MAASGVPRRDLNGKIGIVQMANNAAAEKPGSAEYRDNLPTHEINIFCHQARRDRVFTHQQTRDGPVSDNADFREQHRREAARLRALAATATTAARKARLWAEAEKHEQVRAEGPSSP